MLCPLEAVWIDEGGLGGRVYTIHKSMLCYRSCGGQVGDLHVPPGGLSEPERSSSTFQCVMYRRDPRDRQELFGRFLALTPLTETVLGLLVFPNTVSGPWPVVTWVN